MYENRGRSGHLVRTGSHQVGVNQMNQLRSENLDQESSWWTALSLVTMQVAFSPLYHMSRGPLPTFGGTSCCCPRPHY